MHRRGNIKHFDYDALTDILEQEGLPDASPQFELPFMYDARCRDPAVVDAYLRDPRTDPIEKLRALADYAKVAQRNPETKVEFERNLSSRLRFIAICADKTVYGDEVNTAIRGFYCCATRFQQEHIVN